MTSTALSAPAPDDGPHLTAEEFVARHAGERVELVKGVVKEIPVAGLQHGSLCAPR